MKINYFYQKGRCIPPFKMPKGIQIVKHFAAVSSIAFMLALSDTVHIESIWSHLLI